MRAAHGVRPSPLQGMSYDCDAAQNHYSEIVLPVPDGPFAVTGKVAMRHMIADEDYVTNARIVISSRANGTRRAAPGAFGIHLLAVPARAAKLTDLPPDQTVELAQWEMAQGAQSDAWRVDSAQGGLPFAMRFDGARVATQLGAVVRSDALVPEAPVVRISCSTGEYLFTDLVVKPL
ncbi:hypothetical protein MTR62_09040 [Novosphingobium sp. 1949]|uniref:Uncharacterized protein n=1 Tax=Novosphingobium organovorum TaxID=2930092 RepID=A0ABT0BD59_9SPHN|nr:hypothetical protein [Novosphingobium organovorum]MCJ2182835.1 hypothetical protein [Novosphingobium organovorum]